MIIKKRMRKIQYYILGIVLVVLTSCDFGGVKTGEVDDSINTDGIADSSEVMDINSVDSTSEETSNAMLNDSILGVPNEMVLNGENGLRIEWTIKKENDPIKLNDVVMVNYKARIATGKQFDSNEEMGQPAPIKTNIGMIVEGWEKGLLEMNVGDKGRIMIPSGLAYGENGYTDIIPPNADLIIDIEIVSRVKPIVLEEGVKVYKWKTSDTGKVPEKDQLITFDYFAYLTGEDGGMYDNSFKDSQPFSFKFENDNVIDGLHQGMSVIKPNENAFIEIPYKLAYGSKGLVDLVPKNTDIVYDVRVAK